MQPLNLRIRSGGSSFEGNTIIYPDGLNEGRLIAEGNHGTVYKGYCYGKKCAIKRITLTNLTHDLIEEIQQIAKHAMSVEDGYFVQVFGVCIEPNSCAIVMEHMKEGSLFDFLHYTDKKFSWPIRWRVAIEIGEALRWLHKRNMIHENLKSLSILIDSALHAKLAWPGFARLQGEIERQSSRFIKWQHRWQAPEQLIPRGESTEAVDIYSYGTILGEIASRAIPFPECSDEELKGERLKGVKQEIVAPDAPTTFLHLVQECLRHNPEGRPTIHTILERLRDYCGGNIIKPIVDPTENHRRVREKIANYLAVKFSSGSFKVLQLHQVNADLEEIASQEFALGRYLLELRIDGEVSELDTERLVEFAPQLTSIDLEDRMPSFKLLQKLKNLTALKAYTPTLSPVDSGICGLDNLRDFEISAPSWTYIPLGIFSCTQLRYLKLNLGSLYAVPDAIGKLSYLQTLHINAHNLQSVPRISCLTNLADLTLDCSALKTIPVGISCLTRLVIRSSALTTIPTRLQRLTHLQEFELVAYKLDLTEEDILASLTSLTSLSIECRLPSLSTQATNLQMLSSLRIVSDGFSLPQIEKFTALQVLSVHGKHISPFSGEVRNWVTLTELDISSCGHYFIPSEIQHLRLLKIFRASCNALTSIPVQIGQLEKLVELNCHHNRLEYLPMEISRLTMLTKLDLGYNLIAELPKEIGALTSLQGISLDHNNLKEIPLTIGNLTSLCELNIQENPIGAAVIQRIERVLKKPNVIIADQESAFPVKEKIPLHPGRSSPTVDASIPHGIENVGNSCYINASVQFLFSSNKYFQDYISSLDVEKDSKEEDVIQKLRALIRDRRSSSARDFRKTLATTGLMPDLKMSSLYAQKDAAAFIETLLSFNDDIPEDGQNGDIPEDSRHVFQEQIERGSLFDSTDRQEPKTELQHILRIPLARDGDLERKSFERLLKARFADDPHVDDTQNPLTLDNGRRLITWVEKRKIVNQPEVIIVQLVRFVQDPNGIARKSSNEVMFPEEGVVDFSDAIDVDQTSKYTLIGMVTHLGNSLDGGHYTADVKVNDVWYHYNDSACERRLPDLKNGYLFLFRLMKEAAS